MTHFINSPVRTGGLPAWVESGSIVGVNPKQHTVSWESDNSDKELSDLPILSPYAHQGYGEGMQVLPEEGAQALVLFPSDDATPIVLGFYMDPELQESSENDDEDAPDEVSFLGGNPPPVPGDWYVRGREGNFFILKRDGSLRFGSTPACQTIYFPLQNLLWHVAKKLKINCAGGQIFWDVLKTTSEETILSTSIKETAGSKKATIYFQMGRIPDISNLDGDNPDHVVFNLIVAPEDIDEEGQCSEQKIVLRFDRNGNTYLFTKGTVTTIIKEKWDLTCRNRNILVEQDDTSHIKGNRTITVDGDLLIKAKNIKIEASGKMSLFFTALKMGSAGASQAFVKGLDLVEAFATHTHAFFGTPPVQAPSFFKLISNKIFGE